VGGLQPAVCICNIPEGFAIRSQSDINRNFRESYNKTAEYEARSRETNDNKQSM
jgi:hypothetical protein